MISTPILTVEIVAGNRPVDLERGEADLALRIGAVRGKALRVRCVARVAIGLFAAPHYLQSRPPVDSPASLRGHDVLLPTGELARLSESKWLAGRKGVRVVFRANSMPALVAAAVVGRGIAALGASWAQPGLRRILVLDEIPRRPIYLVARAADSARPAVQVISRRVAEILERVFALSGH